MPVLAGTPAGSVIIVFRLFSSLCQTLPCECEWMEADCDCMTDWMMLNWWSILPCIFPLGNRPILLSCFFMFFMRLRSCIYAPAADWLHTKHVTTTGAPVRCPDSYAHRVFACAGSIRTMNT